MTVKTLRLGRNQNDEMVLKCFYGEEPGDYAEFYINMSREGSLTFVSKDPVYAPVLIEAFGKAMREL